MNVERVHDDFCFTTTEMHFFLQNNIQFNKLEAKYCVNDTLDSICIFDRMSDLDTNCTEILGYVIVGAGDEVYRDKLSNVTSIYGSLTIQGTSFTDLGFLRNLEYVAILGNGILLNLYLFNKQSVMEINCIIDMETVENITAPRVFRSQEQAPICRNFTRISSDKTLQTTLYAFPIGGLGNNLFELISLLGIASTLHRAPVVDATRPEFITTFKEKIQPIFPNLVDQYHLRILPPNSTKNESLNHGPCCKFDNPNKFSNITDEHLYLKGVYLQSFKYFHHLRSEVRKWLAPTSVAKELAGMQLPQAMRQDFIICPHVRRGDFKTDELHEPSDASFTRAATDFLVEKYKKSHFNVSVVVHGNDLQFAYTVFQQDKFLNSSSIISNPYNFTVPKKSPDYQVLISQSTTPELDLAFSRAYCDVTLITAPSSTFGFWLSYLSKDTSVTYYRNINETTDKVANEMKDEDFFPPDWIMLETGKNGEIRRAERNI